MKKLGMLLLALMVALGTIPAASAQSTAPMEAMYHFGVVHKGVGQAIVINLDLTGHFGDPTLTVPVELRVEDNAGNLLWSNNVTLGSDRAIIAVLANGTEMRTARATIQGDIYGAIGPEVRTLQPCIKVLFPPGPSSPVDRITVSLEIMDVLTGRVQVFNNTPHLVVLDTSTMPPPQ